MDWIHGAKQRVLGRRSSQELPTTSAAADASPGSGSQGAAGSSEAPSATSKRERFKMVANYMGDSLAVAGGHLKEAATQGVAATCHIAVAVNHAKKELHDRMLQGGHEGIVWPPDLVVPEGYYTHKIRVEVMAAADLQESAVALLNPYCLITVGAKGIPWSVKASEYPHCRTSVCLRQRHPRWTSVSHLPLSGEHFATGSVYELTVRVMDAHATRADALLGEARLPLDGAPHGAITVRLLGGGFSSLSVRWATGPNDDPSLNAPGMSVDPSVAKDTASIDAASVHVDVSAPLKPPVMVEPPKDDGDYAAWRALLRGNPFTGSMAFWVCALRYATAAQEAQESVDMGCSNVPLSEHVPVRASADTKEAPGAVTSSAADLSAAPPSKASPLASPRTADLIVNTDMIRPEVLETIRQGDVARRFALLLGWDPTSIPRETPALEAHPDTNLADTKKRVEEAERLIGTAGLTELLLQAPLGALLDGDEDALSAVIRSLSERIEVLNALARSRLAGALAAEQLHRPTRHSEPLRDMRETMLHALLHTSHGTTLLEVKRLIDTAGQGYSLQNVCDALSDKLRDSLQDHFQKEAALLGDHRPALVLSDIDMTIWVGPFGAGGPKFPSGAIPGALALYQALGGRITFLSARPPAWEGQTRAALIDGLAIAEANILPGTMANIVKCLYDPTEARRGMGAQKEIAFSNFVGLWPEARFVFFGDSGEGDVDFALSFMKLGDSPGASAVGQAPESEQPASTPANDAAGVSAPPKRIPDRAALIHDVVGPDGITPKTKPEQRKDWAHQGVHVFDTYVGAALHLYHARLLDERGLRSAAQCCLDEFAKLGVDAFKTPEIFEARRKEFLSDMTRLNDVLGTLNPALAIRRKTLQDRITVVEAKRASLLDTSALQPARRLSAGRARCDSSHSSGSSNVEEVAPAPSASRASRGSITLPPPSALKRQDSSSSNEPLLW